jgi:hypothetical protein
MQAVILPTVAFSQAQLYELWHTNVEAGVEYLNSYFYLMRNKLSFTMCFYNSTVRKFDTALPELDNRKGFTSDGQAVYIKDTLESVEVATLVYDLDAPILYRIQGRLYANEFNGDIYSVDKSRLTPAQKDILIDRLLALGKPKASTAVLSDEEEIALANAQGDALDCAYTTKLNATRQKVVSPRIKGKCLC